MLHYWVEKSKVKIELLALPLQGSTGTKQLISWFSIKDRMKIILDLQPS